MSGKRIITREVINGLNFETVRFRVSMDEGRYGVGGMIREITGGDQRESEPEKSEEKYRSFVETMHEGLWVIDADSMTTYVNPAMAEMLGYSADEMIGKPLFEFMDDHGVALAQEKLSDRRTGVGEDHEFEFIRKRGSRSYVLLAANPIMGKDGEYQGAIAGVLDITERKAAEDALKRSEEKMRSIYRAAPVGMGVVVDGVITEVNPLVSKMTGYTKEELIGRGLRVLYPSSEEFENVEKEQYRQIRETGTVSLETRWKRKDGGVIDILLASSFLEHDDASGGVTFTALDMTDRKRSQEELIASETRYRRLFESARDGILILDVSNGKIEDVNPFLIDLLGYSYEEFKGKHIWEIGVFRNVFENEEKFQELKRKEYVRYSHLPLETSDGRSVDVEFVSNVYDVNNSKVIQCNIRDITRRKKMEDELESTLSELSAIHQNAPIVMMLVDNEIKVVKVNGTAARFANRDVDDMIGFPGGEALRCLHSLDDPEGCGFGPVCDKCLIRNAVHDTFRDRKNRNNIEVWLPFPKGKGREERCLEVSTSFLVINEDERVLVCASDITDKKMASIALKDSEEKYRTLIETTSEGYWLLGVRGKTIEVNDALCKLLGYGKEDLIGKSPMNFMDEENRRKYQNYNKDQPKAKNRVYDIQMLSKDGGTRDLMINSTTLFNSRGRRKGAFAMVTDVSKLKRINIELEMEKKRSETFLDLISHDIGNIHQGILLSLSLFDFKPMREELKQKALTNIRNLANRSVHLVRNVIILTRLDSMVDRFRNIDVIDMIGNSLESCRSMFPDRTIRYGMKTNKEKVLIKAEPILGEVFFNLFHNCINAQHDREPRIETEVIVDKDRSCVRVLISDWGPGISDDMKEKLLYRDPRDRVHSGIGLSLVRELLNRYHGTVRILDRVYGDVKTGASFELTFPLSDKIGSRKQIT